MCSVIKRDSYLLNSADVDVCHLFGTAHVLVVAAASPQGPTMHMTGI